MDGPITEQIRKWMLLGGRPLEMRIAAELARHSHEVEQSAFYTDVESGAREIDVVARFTSAHRFFGSLGRVAEHVGDDLGQHARLECHRGERVLQTMR